MKIIKPSFEILNIPEPTDHDAVLMHIERIGRTCYKSEDKITPDSCKKFITALRNHKHWAMLEHYIFTLSVPKWIYDNIINTINDDSDDPDLVMKMGYIHPTHWNESTDPKYEYLVSFSATALNYLIRSNCCINATDDAISYLFKFMQNHYPELMSEPVSDIERDTDEDICFLSRSEIRSLPDNLRVVHDFMSVRFIVDRGVTHEMVRHRPASWAQESTRYCVAGNMKLSTKNPHMNFTVAELYKHVMLSKNGSWKRLNIRQYDETTHELVYAKVKAVYANGKKHCITIKTKLGYELTCTDDHEIRCENEYIAAGKLKIGDNIMVNGTEELYKNCESCHQLVHSKNLMTGYMDKIVDIKDAGMEYVYDIEMDSENHNFIANGIVVHNCNYSQGKFENEITVIMPSFFKVDSDAFECWKVACELAEQEYLNMLYFGATPQQARTVLPQSTKAELNMTATLYEFKHFFKMRCETDAHPQMREVACPLLIESNLHNSYYKHMFDDTMELFKVEDMEEFSW